MNFCRQFCRSGQNIYLTFSKIFSETCTHEEIMWQVLKRRTVERLHYIRNASLDFTILDN